MTSAVDIFGRVHKFDISDTTLRLLHMGELEHLTRLIGTFGVSRVVQFSHCGSVIF